MSMPKLSRAVAVLFLTVGLLPTALTADEQQGGRTVPKPISPKQKVTAHPSNPDSAVLADFNARLDNYVKNQRALLKELPISKDASPEEIKRRQEALAAELRTIRRSAKQGDIFTPDVAALFKRLLSPEVKAQPRETKQALEEEDGEVAQVHLKVNAAWPASEPLTTVPANLLAALPQLPKDVEYRISHKRHLVLRDVDANIIVDYIYNAIR
jgi:hypothetical protein